MQCDIYILLLYYTRKEIYYDTRSIGEKKFRRVQFSVFRFLFFTMSYAVQV